MSLKERDGPRDEAVQPRGTELSLKIHRCPYCHEDIETTQRDGWLSCASCQARHHRNCWAESGSCASCRGTAYLTPTTTPVAPPASRRPTGAKKAIAGGVTVALTVGALFVGGRWSSSQQSPTSEKHAPPPTHPNASEKPAALAVALPEVTVQVRGAPTDGDEYDLTYQHVGSKVNRQFWAESSGGHITRVPPGETDVTFVVHRRHSSNARTLSRASWRIIRRVVVTGQDLQLDWPANATGRVEAALGPSDYVRTAWLKSESFKAEADVSLDGALTLDRLPPGDYRLAVTDGPGLFEPDDLDDSIVVHVQPETTVTAKPPIIRKGDRSRVAR
jgi:hypothetical protein